jgi:hypothetical protein
MTRKKEGRGIHHLADELAYRGRRLKSENGSLMIEAADTILSLSADVAIEETHAANLLANQRQLESDLRRIAGMAGAPDAAGACRNIIAFVREILAGERPVEF